MTLEVVTENSRDRVDVDILNSDYGGVLSDYVDIEITPQSEWWLESN